MSQNQDDVKKYVVWIGPNDEVAVAVVSFNTKEELLAYLRGMNDAHGWDYGMTFDTQAEASAFVSAEKEKFEAQKEVRLRQHGGDHKARA